MSVKKDISACGVSWITGWGYFGQVWAYLSFSSKSSAWTWQKVMTQRHSKFSGLFVLCMDHSEFTGGLRKNIYGIDEQ